MADFKTAEGTLSFPHVDKAQPRVPGGEPVFSCSLIFDKEAQKSVAYKKLKEECDRLAAEKAKEMKISLSKVRSPFMDGAEKKYAGYGPGTVYVSPWSKFKPPVVDAEKVEMDAGDLFAGMKARLNVSAYSWSKSGNHGVSLALNAIQITDADAERIDGRKSAAAMFDDEDEEEVAF